MSSRSRKRFVRDLTRTRHMATVSAVLLGTTFMPLLGLPDVEELHAFQGAIEGFTDARAEVLAPHRNDEAARERIAESVISERPAEGNLRFGDSGNHILTVEHPTHQPAEAIDYKYMSELDELPPLPDETDIELAQPVDDEVIAPDPVETQSAPDALEEPDDLDEPADVEEAPVPDKPTG